MLRDVCDPREEERERDAEVRAEREHVRCVVLFGSFSCTFKQS